MKLYKIMLRHCGQKSCEEFVKQHVIARDDLQVMKGIDEQYLFNMWSERHDNGRLLKIYDEAYNVIAQESYLDRMLRVKGEFNDPDASYDDAYYGIHHYGWQEGVDISEEELKILSRFVEIENWLEKN